MQNLLKAPFPYPFRIFQYAYSKGKMESVYINIETCCVEKMNGTVRLGPYYASTLKAMEWNWNENEK